MSSKVALWIKAARVPFLQASILPVFIGGAFASFSENLFSWGAFIGATLGIVCIHLGTNLINDYYDHVSLDDDINVKITPLSGGSRVIQQGLLPPRHIMRAGMICFLGGIIIGFFLLLRLGWPLLFLGFIGILGGFFYTAPPFKIGYRGAGEILVGILLGPLAVLGGYLVCTEFLSWKAVWVSLPIGVLVAAILFINEFPDYDADKEVKKLHLVVRLGLENSRYVFMGLMAAPFVILVLLISANLMPPAAWWLFLALPLAVVASNFCWRFYNDYKRMIPAQALTIVLHLIFGVGMTIALIVG